MKIFIDISHNPSVYSKCKQKIVHDKGKRKEMKKALAVLVIMMVALTSVFAVDAAVNNVTNSTQTGSVLTLSQTINGSVVWTLQYSLDNGTSYSNFTTVEEDVDLVNGGRGDLRIKLDANTAKALNRTYSFTTTPFKLYNGDRVVNENAVATTFSITPKVVTGSLWSASNPHKADSEDTDNSQIVITMPANTRMDSEQVVAEGSLSWGANSALVAGEYKATITVTITDGQ